LVAAALARKGLAGFLPLYRSRRRWSDRIKELELPLFPGYVFCWFAYGERLKVLKTPGVTSLVRFGKTVIPVPDQEIQNLKILVSSGLPVSPWPVLQVGQRIHIVHGPLSGVDGILLRIKDSWRVVVSVSLLSRSVAVEIDRAIVAPSANHAGLRKRSALPGTGIGFPIRSLPGNRPLGKDVRGEAPR
jgi:transcription antitermination factor NusG